MLAVIGIIAVLVIGSRFYQRVLISDDYRHCVQDKSNTFAQNMFGVQPGGFQLNEIEDKCAGEVGKYIWD